MRAKVLIVIINLLCVTANKKRPPALLDRLLTYLSVDDNESRCQFDVSRSNKRQPLLVHPHTSAFLRPTERSGVLTMRHSDEIELFCSAGFSHPASLADNSVRISCQPSGHFRSSHSSADVSGEDFECRKHPFHTARRRTRERCFDNATFVDIGFEVGERFIAVLTVCYDERRQTTHYAHYALTPASVAAQRGIKRPSFIQGDFFAEKDVGALYAREHQRKIIGADALPEAKATVYLSRGHLAAKGDFIYGNEQRATFYYINAVPQWESFNGQNWRAVEDGSRRLAADRNITLAVYTGTHGTLSMRDSKGQMREIYLDMVNKQVPVPRLFYKLLVNARSDSGVALVCVNNVYATLDEIQRDYIICEDVSDAIRYIKWRRGDVRRGYCYACRVDEFLESVPHLDGLSVKRLLV